MESSFEELKRDPLFVLLIISIVLIFIGFFVYLFGGLLFGIGLLMIATIAVLKIPWVLSRYFDSLQNTKTFAIVIYLMKSYDAR